MIVPLAQACCAVLVPDMRGYGDSDKLTGDDGYDARALAEEFRALVAAIGRYWPTCDRQDLEFEPPTSDILREQVLMTQGAHRGSS